MAVKGSAPLHALIFLLLSFIFTSAHGDGLENLILDQDIHILVSLLH